MEYHILSGRKPREAKEAMNMRAVVGYHGILAQVQHSIVGTNANPYLPDANITQRKPQNWGRSLMSISRSAMVLNMMKHKNVDFHHFQIQKKSFRIFQNPQ